MHPRPTKLALLFALLAGLSACGSAEVQRDGSGGDPLNGISGEQLFERAIELADVGDLQRSEQYFVASMERGLEGHVVIPYLVRICVAQSRYSGALAYLEPLLEREPARWRLRRLHATLLAGLGRNQEAEAQFHRVLTQTPTDATTHYFLGMFYREHQKRPEAREHLQAYLEYAEDDAHRAEVEEHLARMDEWDRADFQSLAAPEEAVTPSDESAGEGESEQSGGPDQVTTDPVNVGNTAPEARAASEASSAAEASTVPSAHAPIRQPPSEVES